MKPLSYTQKKWAMATFLVGVLTVSASLHTPAKISQLDLASTDNQVDGKLATGDGVVDVKYIKNGEQVMAVLLAAPEGKVCEACGKSYNLSVAFDKNKGDINALNDALLAHIKNSNPKDKVREEAPSKENEKDNTKNKEKKDFALFKRGFDSCKYDEKLEKSECMVKAYMETIQSKRYSKNDKISADVALEVFITEIEPSLASVLSSSTDWKNADEARSLEVNINKVLLMLDKIKSDLPEQQNNVRSRLMVVERKIIETRSIALKQNLEKFKANLNDNSTRNQITFERRILGNLISSIDSMNDPSSMKTNRNQVMSHTLQSLKVALENNNITSEQALQFYTVEYNKTVQAMLDGLNKSYKDLGTQSIVDPAAIILESQGLLNGTIPTGTPRTNVPNAGAMVRSTLPAGVLNNQMNNMSSRPGTTASSNLQVPQQGRTFQGRGF